MALKRGKYSVDEEKYMRENLGKKPIDEVAAFINRSPDAVQKWGLSKGLIADKTDADIGDKNRCLVILHDLSYWSTVVQELTNEEITFYEDNWYPIFKQLNEDVSQTEQMYIKQWLMAEVDLHRLRLKDKQALEQMDELKEKIRILKKVPVDMRDSQDIAELALLESDLKICEATMTNYIRAKAELNKDIKTISEKIKADRHERREKVSSADTYWGYLEMLENLKYKEAEIYKAEIGRAAMEKAKLDLYGVHEYMDKTVDHPILSAESLEHYDSIGNNEEEE